MRASSVRNISQEIRNATKYSVASNATAKLFAGDQDNALEA
jgi:hypothetical protein